MKITVRKANPADFETIQKLNLALFEHDKTSDPSLDLGWPHRQGPRYYTDHINGKDGVCFVALAGDQPVGYLIGGFSDQPYRSVKVCELENMFIEEPFRRQGAGRLLFERFMAWSRQQGAKRVMVEAYAGNQNAVTFYKSVGFDDFSVNLEMDVK